MTMAAVELTEAFDMDEPRTDNLFDWDSYVRHLCTSDSVHHAAIYSVKGERLAATGGFELTQDEHARLVYGIHAPNIVKRTGLAVNGATYKVHLVDGRSGVMAKNGLPDPGGFSACKTERLVVIATYKGKMNPKICNEVVMTLGDFFRLKGL